MNTDLFADLSGPESLNPVVMSHSHSTSDFHHLGYRMACSKYEDSHMVRTNT